jgi:hypothetical protein
MTKIIFFTNKFLRNMKEEFKDLYTKNEKIFTGLKRIDLLKKIEFETDKLFEVENMFIETRTILGKDKEDLAIKASKQNFEVDEFSKEFYLLLENVSSKRQNLSRYFIKTKLQNSKYEDDGFSDFERVLLINSCDISSFYDDYYFKWIKSVQGNNVSEYLNEKLKKKEIIDEKFLNNYTILEFDENNQLFQTTYSKYFENQISPIVKCFDTLLGQIEKINDLNEDEQNYYKYLVQYKKALVQDDITLVDKEWELLDELWMSVRHDIQIVHDIGIKKL